MKANKSKANKQKCRTDYFPFSYTASDTELDTFESKVLHLNLKTIMCIYLTLNQKHALTKIQNHTAVERTVVTRF